MPGIGIILNPHSKKHKKDPERMDRLAFIVGDKGSCKATHDLADLQRVAEEFKTRDIEILGIGGGDGTIHMTLTTFIRVYGDKPLPKITFLRGGTLNTMAMACGIKGSPEKIISNLLYVYHEDHPLKIKELDCLNVNGEYGFIFGVGVIYRFMDAYYKKGNRSPLGAGITLAHSIGSALINGKFASEMFARMGGEVWVNGKKWPFQNYSAIYAGSVDRLGLKFRVFHYSEEPRKFHAVSFSLPPRNILRHVPSMFMGKHSNCEDMLEEPADEMLIKLEEAQPYTIDGDMLPAQKEISVKIGPRLQVVVV